MSHNCSHNEDASPFSSPFITKERSNSIQLSLGNGVASIVLPSSFSQDCINDLMSLAYKFELEEEVDDLENEEQCLDERIDQQIGLNLSSNKNSQIEEAVYN